MLFDRKGPEEYFSDPFLLLKFTTFAILRWKNSPVEVTNYKKSREN